MQSTVRSRRSTGGSVQFVDRQQGRPLGRRQLGRSKTSLELAGGAGSTRLPRLSKAERAARSASALDRLVRPDADHDAPAESDQARRSRLSASSSFLLELHTVRLRWVAARWPNM
eukprot:SAG31_NODE_1457_length_8260_cov_2.805416_5_plen_115_part_00